MCFVVVVFLLLFFQLVKRWRQAQLDQSPAATAGSVNRRAGRPRRGLVSKFSTLTDTRHSEFFSTLKHKNYISAKYWKVPPQQQTNKKTNKQKMNPTILRVLVLVHYLIIIPPWGAGHNLMRRPACRHPAATDSGHAPCYVLAHSHFSACLKDQDQWKKSSSRINYFQQPNW